MFKFALVSYMFLPSYDVLKQKVTDNGLSATGREYGVAGNTIKQWICKYETGKCR